MNTTNSTVNIDNVNVYNNTLILSKVCIKCNQIKSLTEYYKDKRKSVGLESCCKSCEYIKSKHYRDKNRQNNTNKFYNENNIKTCSKCKQQKLYTEFYKCATKSLGLESYCKDCKANDFKKCFRIKFS